MMTTTWSPLIKPPSVAVHIALPKAMCVEKILGRVECGECGGVYNLASVEDDAGGWFLPGIFPTKKSFCPKCGTFDRTAYTGRNCDEDWMLRRPDDADPAVVAGRISEYEAVTEKILESVPEEDLVTFEPKRGLESFPELLKAVKEKLAEKAEEEDDFL